jgi:hypothetical protein
MAGDEELPDEERARALARVKRSLWELTQMVENVLESSAEEAGALVLAPEPIEVSALFEELGASARISRALQADPHPDRRRCGPVSWSRIGSGSFGSCRT